MKLTILLFASAFVPADRLAEAKLTSTMIDGFEGIVQMRAIADGSGAITINIKNASPGVYSAYLFDTADCAQVPMMYTDPTLPYGGGKADRDRAALLTKAGEVTVGDDGRGHVEAAARVLLGIVNVDSLDKKAVALFLQRPIAKVSKHLRWQSVASGPDACGVFHVRRDVRARA
jgi:hypothetical protein